ncbi:MAG: hypothetical protein MUC76_04645 [Spirochaetes bacterium]|jgi:hypothetical protein|nr:hypothetical protein [Spirochaetota bacterium]
MSETIDYLLKNSGLPGPRGNLELLYSFAKTATADEVEACMSLYDDDLRNSPEEFVVMCGIVARCILRKDDIAGALAAVRAFAVHESWRIRESVAIGIQEIAGNDMHAIIDVLEKWVEGNALERRAVVAALCEPKLLKDSAVAARVLRVLGRITIDLERAERLTDGQVVLRKALGYGWSVVVAASPEVGKAAFEAIAGNTGKHIRWIVRENLKKNRLMKMDARWVERMRAETG